MNDDAKRSILLDVAAGRISPEEAATRLGELGHDLASSEAPPSEAPPSRQPPATDASGVRVEAAAGRVHITGDPDIAGIIVDEGEHTIRREGDLVVIERELPVDDESGSKGFTFAFSSGRRGRVRVGPRMNLHNEPPLVVRMNPDLPLELLLNAGTFAIRGVHAPLRCELNAGSGRIEGFRSPLDATVNAGSLTARGRLDHGASTIRCDAGSVRLELEDSSDLAISLSTTLGKATVDLPGQAIESGAGLGDRRTFTLGKGTGSLDVRVNLGKVHIGRA